MTVLQSLGMMLIRGMVGYIMFYHGSQKLFGWFGGQGMAEFTKSVAGLKLPVEVPAQIAAYAAAVSEFGGGILLMLGLATRFAGVAVAGVMAVAAFVVHLGKFSGPGGMEFPLLILFVAVGLVFTGPGRFALDNLFVRRRGKAKAAKKAD